MSAGWQPTLVRLPMTRSAKSAATFSSETIAHGDSCRLWREERPCLLEQPRTDHRFVALIAGVNSDWRHESDERRPGNRSGNRIACLRGPKAKSAVAGVGLDNRPHRSSKCLMPDPVDPTPPPASEPISTAEWKSYFHRSAVQRRRRARLCSAGGRPDFLHPGKARSVRSFLRDAIDHLRRRLVPLQHRLDDSPWNFLGASGDRADFRRALGFSSPPWSIWVSSSS